MTCNVLDLDGCGSGKSLVGVELGLQLARFPVLIVTPKTPRDQWHETIMQQTFGEAAVLIADKEHDLPQGLADALFPEWVITHPAHLRLRAKAFAKISWPLVIVDEAHLYRNPDSQQFKALAGLRCWRKLMLTATPMHKSPAEMFAMLHWLYPRDFPHYWPFRKHYTVEEKNYLGYYEFVDTRNEAELAAKLRPFTFRRTLADLEPDLPPRIVTYVKVAPSEEVLAVHESVRKAGDILVTPPGAPGPELITNTLTEIGYLRQVVSNPAAKGFSFPSVKIEWVKEYIRENPDQRVVVMCYYIETSRAMGEALGVQGLYAKKVGLREAVAEFRRGMGPNVLVGTYGSLGVGTDLPGADCIIIADLLYQRIAFEQAIDRIYRLGITTPKVVKVLHCPGTVDDLLMRALQDNWTTVQLVMQYLRSKNSLSLV